MNATAPSAQALSPPTMPDLTTFGLFLRAALALAITPDPGILSVMTRSLKGDRREGIASSLGTAVGGMFHVIAAALGISVISTPGQHRHLPAEGG